MSIQGIDNSVTNTIPVVTPSTVAASTPVVTKAVTGDKPASVATPQATIPASEVKKAVQDVNTALQNLSSLQFSVDPNGSNVTVKIIDTETKTVIRQIPNEEVKAIKEALDKLQLLKQKA